jgi:hypothetical protein
MLRHPTSPTGAGSKICLEVMAIDSVTLSDGRGPGERARTRRYGGESGQSNSCVCRFIKIILSVCRFHLAGSAAYPGLAVATEVGGRLQMVQILSSRRLRPHVRPLSAARLPML